MPRKPRALTDTGVYHVIARGNNRQFLFREAKDHKVYLDILRDLKSLCRFDVYHYCLMTNHVHLLMRFYDSEGLQKVMQRLNLAYAKRYRKAYRYYGHVFQDRFKSFAIEKDAYLLECGRYIGRNPIRAGLAHTLDEYLWCSYAYYAHGKPDDLLTPNPCYEGLGVNAEERQDNYRQYLAVMRPYEKLIEEGLLRS